MVKNMFVFACYTGLSYSDLIQLKPANIQIGIDGESWIKTNRQKTKTPVTSVAEELQEKHHALK